ncbi:MAG TPA: SgcJ/EcaC family oxidoreductase [Desulfomonilaceae bacterium]|nr:SgcJ/EcaC family oxidoreductase [Desulfomonilaceae bacterium]
MMRLALFIIIAVLNAGPILAQNTGTDAKEETAIRRGVESYVQAFNQGDAKAFAGFWADNAEYITPSGERLKGRDKIEKAFKQFFSNNKGAQVNVHISGIRFPRANEAVEEGTAVVSRPGQKDEEFTYVLKYVKRNSAWKINRVEEAAKIPSNYEHLKELEWLVGDWVDESDQMDVETSGRWTRNKNFITLSFAVTPAGGTPLQGTQVIGWDPAMKRIRSWVFDSSGGFGEGVWSKEGSRWAVKMSSVLATGEKASSINIYSPVDNNAFLFSSTGREINGEPQPNIDEVRVVRKPAKR